MKELIDILRIFLEKHFMPAVSAVAIALIAIVLIPSDWFVITKLGSNWFKLLLFCLAFLTVKGIIKFHQYIRIKIIEANDKKEKVKQQEILKIKKREYENAQNDKALEELWQFTDTLGLQDKKYIDKFLKTKNAPIKIKEDGDIWDSKLLNSKAVHKTLVKSGVDAGYHWEADEYQYILNNDIYQLLKLSKEEYGKVSHFD